MHPDRVPIHMLGATAAAFQQLAHAYDVLGQESKWSRRTQEEEDEEGGRGDLKSSLRRAPGTVISSFTLWY